MVSKDKLVIGLGIFAFLIFLVGFASPYWIYTSILEVEYKEGLWEACTNGICGSLVNGIPTQDWFKVVQAWECLGFIAGLLASVMLLLPMIGSTMQENRTSIYEGATTTFIIAGILGLVGVTIYGAKVITSNIHFAYAFTTIGSVGFLVAGVLAKRAWAVSQDSTFLDTSTNA